MPQRRMPGPTWRKVISGTNRSGDNSTRLNGMGWLQYGLNYSAILADDGHNQWKAGISVNYLQGIVAAYAKNSHLNYTLGDTTQIAFTNSSVDYGRTDYDIPYRKIGSYGDLNHGHGFGVDWGVSCSSMRRTPGCRRSIPTAWGSR